MISNKEILRIKKLKQKKYRTLYGQFVAEGIKTINHILNSSIECKAIYTSETPEHHLEIQIKHSELCKMSALKSPSSRLGVFTIPKPAPLLPIGKKIVVEDLSDPGNLGTLIRLCDWFGISTLICSSHTVDCFNPKVIQASMGSIANVNCIYLDLETFFIENKQKVYGTTLFGNSIYEEPIDKDAVLYFGSESHGISEKFKLFLDKTITIPKHENASAESLNIAMAAGIIMSHWK